MVIFTMERYLQSYCIYKQQVPLDLISQRRVPLVIIIIIIMDIYNAPVSVKKRRSWRSDTNSATAKQKTVNIVQDKNASKHGQQCTIN